MKCDRCGTHHDASDEARCSNARRLGIELNRRLTLAPVKCEHVRYVADAGTFLLQTEHWRELADEADRVIEGECLKCGTVLRLYVGSAVAVRVMRGEVAP